MQGYIRLNKTTNSRGFLIPVSEYLDRSKLESYIQKAPESDWYASMFVLGNEAKEYYDQYKTISKYSGPAYSSKLVFDLDYKGDLQKAKDDTQKLLRKLKEDISPTIASNVRIYFSGSKGFHVYLYTDDSFGPDEMKEICSVICEDIDSFDQVVYESVRMFRIENTKHQKSGLHKIELAPKEFVKMSAEEIKEKAKSPVKLDRTVFPVKNFNFREFYKKKEKSNVIVPAEFTDEDDSGIRGLSSIDFNKCPKDTPKCIYALMQGIMIPGIGERNHIFLHLGNHFRNKGLSKELVHNMLKGVARLNKKLYPESEPFTKEEIWDSIITRVFGDENSHNTGGWGVDPEDEIFSRYCSKIKHGRKCPIHEKSENSNKKEILNIDQVFDSFENFAENFESNTVKTGINFIDENMKIPAGTITLLVGSAGSGKTSMCINIMRSASRQGLHSVFFSLDMPKNLVYLKLAQHVTNYDQQTILDAFNNKNEEVKKHIKDEVSANFGNVHFDFSRSLSVEDMIERIEHIEKIKNVKVNMVFVDHSGRIEGPYKDEYQNSTYNARMSNTAADRTDAAWIILSQISRANGDTITPLRSKRISQGSGSWEAESSQQINVWRPFCGLDGRTDEEGNEFKDSVMKIFLAKNRMNSELEGTLLWKGAKGVIRDMTPEQLERYETEKKPLEKKAYKIIKGGF